MSPEKIAADQAQMADMLKKQCFKHATMRLAEHRERVVGSGKREEGDNRGPGGISAKANSKWEALKGEKEEGNTNDDKKGEKEDLNELLNEENDLDVTSLAAMLQRRAKVKSGSSSSGGASPGGRHTATEGALTRVTGGAVKGGTPSCTAIGEVVSADEKKRGTHAEDKKQSSVHMPHMHTPHMPHMHMPHPFSHEKPEPTKEGVHKAWKWPWSSKKKNARSKTVITNTADTNTNSANNANNANTNANDSNVNDLDPVLARALSESETDVVPSIEELAPALRELAEFVEENESAIKPNEASGGKDEKSNETETKTAEKPEKETTTITSSSAEEVLSTAEGAINLGHTINRNPDDSDPNSYDLKSITFKVRKPVPARREGSTHKSAYEKPPPVRNSLVNRNSESELSDSSPTRNIINKSRGSATSSGSSACQSRMSVQEKRLSIATQHLRRQSLTFLKRQSNLRLLILNDTGLKWNLQFMFRCYYKWYRQYDVFLDSECDFKVN